MDLQKVKLFCSQSVGRNPNIFCEQCSRWIQSVCFKILGTWRRRVPAVWFAILLWNLPSKGASLSVNCINHTKCLSSPLVLCPKWWKWILIIFVLVWQIFGKDILEFHSFYCLIFLPFVCSIFWWISVTPPYYRRGLKV
jgi:hypothetical protein